MPTLRERYTELDTERSAALARKREHAAFTDPSLLPPQGRAMGTPLDVPYNTLPAEGGNALASRIMSVVFPLNGQSVFEILLEQQFNPSGQDNSDLTASFGRFERQVMDFLAPTNLRSAINLAYKHEINIGDCLIFMDDDANFRIFRFDQYVVRRKHEGDWQEIIIQEAVNPDFHPQLKNVKGTPSPNVNFSVMGAGRPDNWEPLYTHVRKLDDGQVDVVQEFRDQKISATRYKVSPYFPVRWSALAGEPYGISLVESMFGDIRALDALSKALLDGAMLNAEYRWGVNPAGITELQDMLDSINGDYVPAAQDDVFPLQFQNSSQVQHTQLAVAHREQIVGRRFLMNSAIQPQGERVTARQVSILAQELESQLGGVLSNAAREIQEPILRRTIYLMGQKNLIPKEISDEIQKQGGFLRLRIRAGLEILNREAEREKLDAAIERMRNLPPEANRAFNWGAIARDWWQSMGLETEGRIKTDQQMEQERMAEQRAAVASQAAELAAQQGLRQPQEQ